MPDSTTNLRAAASEQHSGFITLHYITLHYITVHYITQLSVYGEQIVGIF